MNPILTTLLAFAMLAVLAVMILGIISMLKGGEFNKKYGNKLMQYRVIFQGIAITLLVLVFAAANK